MSSGEESDDDSSVNLDIRQVDAGKEAIIFLVDATKTMFECYQFSLAVQCIINVMKNKAISKSIDEIAVIFFGTGKSSDDKVYDHIYTFIKLGKVSVKSISQLKHINESDFGSEFGHSNNFSLGEVFSAALQEFKNRKLKFDSKRVILFTSTCNPYSGESEEAKKLRNIAIQKAQNFNIYDIECELIPLASKEGVFDITAFYQEVFPDLKYEECNTLTKLEPLLRRVYKKRHRNRALASIPFRFGPQVNISVKLYTLYSETRKPSRIRVKQETQELRDVLSSQELRTILPTTQTEAEKPEKREKIKPKDLAKVYTYGDENFYVTKVDEMKLVQFEEPALTLLGFKDLTAFQSHLHIKPGHFIFPNETEDKSGITLFNALLLRCVQRNKIPLCRLTLKSHRPRLVALYPQFEDKLSAKPGGFHLAYLPFREDVRDLEIKENNVKTYEKKALDLGLSIIDKLNIDYDPKDFPNPVLQTLYRAIEGMALNESIEPFDDNQTQPNYEDIELKAGYDMYELNQLLGGYRVKRIQTKPVKTYSEEFIRDSVTKNKLGILTVAELKEICKSKNIKEQNLRKGELIEAIHRYYKSHK